jgi:RNA polymerase sigma factor (sigma-70 family)
LRPAQAEAARLYAAHRRWVYSLCRSRLRTREDAEDAVQLTFLYAFRSLQRDILPKQELAWLRTIADNVCRTRRRDASSRSQHESVSDVHAVEHLLPARERSEADAESLRAALELLTEAQRRAVLLREWQGLSYKEIATTLGVSEPAVETLLFRARRRLAGSLGELRRALDVAAAIRLARKLGAGGAGKATAAAVISVGVVAAAGPPLAHHFEHASHVQRPRVHAAATPSSPAAARPSLVRPAAQTVLLATQRVRPHPKRDVQTRTASAALVPAPAQPTAVPAQTTTLAPDRPATATTAASPAPEPASTPVPAQQPAATGSTATATTPASQPPATDPVSSVVDTAGSTAATAVSEVTSTAGQAADAVTSTAGQAANTVTTAVDTVTSALPTVTAPTVTTPKLP